MLQTQHIPHLMLPFKSTFMVTVVITVVITVEVTVEVSVVGKGSIGVEVGGGCVVVIIGMDGGVC